VGVRFWGAKPAGKLEMRASFLVQQRTISVVMVAFDAIHPYTFEAAQYVRAPLHDQTWNPGVSTRFLGLGIALHATGLSPEDPAPVS
jgi:hypothetical protein